MMKILSYLYFAALLAALAVYSVRLVRNGPDADARARQPILRGEADTDVDGDDLEAEAVAADPFADCGADGYFEIGDLGFISCEVDFG